MRVVNPREGDREVNICSAERLSERSSEEKRRGNFALAGTVGDSSSPSAVTMDGQTGFGYSDAFLVELNIGSGGAASFL